MKVNVCGNKYRQLTGGWTEMYLHVIEALHQMGADIHISPYLSLPGCPDYVIEGIEDSDDAIYIHNHTNVIQLAEQGFHMGSQSLFLKPTAPTPYHFTIDPMGYAASSSIAYQKPDFEDYDSTDFFENELPGYLESRANKWSDQAELQFNQEELDVPEDHVLLIGQMPGDETVTEMSFGDHWVKMWHIIRRIQDKSKIVVKVHPTLEREASDWDSKYLPDIEVWRSMGITVFHGFESLYDILPKTRVAIVENSTSGIECLMMEVPVISYGFPEYHWVTQDMRHVNLVQHYINDLSWHDAELAKSWVAWYCQEYQCKDLPSTIRRLNQLLSPI